MHSAHQRVADGRTRRSPDHLLDGGTYPAATSAPLPKKCLSICSARYLRALTSARLRRFSFISIFWCSSHCPQASFDTLSNIFFPSSPGYGGKSRPSASRPSLTHLTILGIFTPLKMVKCVKLGREAEGLDF